MRSLHVRGLKDIECSPGGRHGDSDTNIMICHMTDGDRLGLKSDARRRGRPPGRLAGGGSHWTRAVPPPAAAGRGPVTAGAHITPAREGVGRPRAGAGPCMDSDHTTAASPFKFESTGPGGAGPTAGRTTPARRPLRRAAARPCIMIGRAPSARPRRRRSHVDGVHLLDWNDATPQGDSPSATSAREHSQSASPAQPGGHRHTPGVSIQVASPGPPPRSTRPRAQAGRNPPRRNGETGTHRSLAQPVGPLPAARRELPRVIPAVNPDRGLRRAAPHSGAATVAREHGRSPSRVSEQTAARHEPLSPHSGQLDRGPRRARPRPGATATRNLTCSTRVAPPPAWHQAA
jgi:hypothetical protein